MNQESFSANNRSSSVVNHPASNRLLQEAEVLLQNEADTVYGLIVKLLPIEADAQGILHELRNFVSANMSRYNPKRCSMLTWLLITARTLAMQKLVKGITDRNVMSDLDKISFNKQSICQLHNKLGYTPDVIAKRLSLPPAAVAFCLRNS